MGKQSDEKFEEGHYVRPPNRSSAHHTLLRILIYTQIVWIFVVGMVCRGVITVDDSLMDFIPPLVEVAVTTVVVASLFAYPLMVIVAIRYSRLSPGKAVGVFVAEAGLAVTHFLALLPTVQ